MDEGVAAVRLGFPGKAEAINELASRDGVFCEICRDFAEAHAELAKWQASSDPHGDHRSAEYRELIAGLRKEIEDALDRANVVSLHHPQAHRPR